MGFCACLAYPNAKKHSISGGLCHWLCHYLVTQWIFPSSLPSTLPYVWGPQWQVPSAIRVARQSWGGVWPCHQHHSSFSGCYVMGRKHTYIYREGLRGLGPSHITCATHIPKHKHNPVENGICAVTTLYYESQPVRVFWWKIWDPLPRHDFESIRQHNRKGSDESLWDGIGLPYHTTIYDPI